MPQPRACLRVAFPATDADHYRASSPASSFFLSLHLLVVAAISFYHPFHIRYPGLSPVQLLQVSAAHLLAPRPATQSLQSAFLSPPNMSSVIQPTMPATTNALSKRRRFQPPITNFFATTPSEPDSHDPHVSHYHYSAATFSATPVVSAKVQSSLLSVGMRVRKSVAEGYKTKLVKEDGTPSLPGTATNTSSLRSYPSRNTRAELAPFSGFPRPSPEQYYGAPSHPSTSATMTNDIINDDGDAFSLPASSQESTSSSTAQFPGRSSGQKRSLDSEKDMLSDDDECSPQPWDANSSEMIWQNASVGRTILAPKLGQQHRRMLATQRAMQRHSGALEQPNMMMGDFEEASFLRRREEVDGDYEQMDCA